jgi:4-hydroxy-3-polyprenylbenzoate decarboxylase
MTVKIDYDSIPRSYREYLELMVKEGEYLAIDDEVDWDLEMGAICRYADETMSPSPIFNKVKDSPEFRAAEWGFTKSGTRGRPWCRVAPNVGAPPDATLMEILEAYMHSVENNPVHPPKILDAKDAPCKENKWTGDDIDLMKLPVPLQHAGDAERMLQSAGVNTCQTPDGKWTSWSINRSAVHDKNTMKGYWIAPNQHNGMVWAQWAEKGEDMPFAIAFGVPPVCAWQSASRIPDNVSEYDVASQMLNAPIEMVKCETNDLLVPATSEIVVEGVVSASEMLMEGPYGEHAGYHFDHKKAPKQRQDITCVTFRNNAILPTAVPAVTPNSTVIGIAVCNSGDVVLALKKEGFPVIDGLATIESSGSWFVLRVKNDWHKTTGWSLDEFMTKLGKFIWWDHIGGCFTKLLVVGEDIDPEDPLAVTYAFATRNHPEKGVWFFADSPKFGVGTEAYHTTEDYFGRIGVPGQKIKSGSGICIYSCLGTEEMVDQPKPHILTFRRAWPKDVQDKVLANWDKWGFRTPDPVLQKHASQSTPWVYFEKTGEGETPKGEYESKLKMTLGAGDNETEERA